MSTFTDQLNATNHSISWQQGKAMVNYYNQQKINLLSGALSGTPAVLLDYETFNLGAIQSIMNQPGVAGFRIYMGMTTANLIISILVGVDAMGGDIIMNNGNCSLSAVEELGQRMP